MNAHPTPSRTGLFFWMLAAVDQAYQSGGDKMVWHHEIAARE
jgi:hypothetical protein